MAALRSSCLKLLMAVLLLVSYLQISDARGVHRSRVARNADSDMDDVVADMAKLDSDDFEMGDDASNGYMNNEEDGDDDEDEDDDEEIPMAELKSRSQMFDVAEGSTVWLPCEVENDKLEVIQWKKDTTALFQNQVPQKADPRLHIHGNHTLRISNVQPSDAGEYRCIVVSVANITHTLRLFTAPKILKMLPEDKQRLVREGSTVKLQCLATGNPKPEVIFSRGGVRITNGLFEEDSVILENVKKADGGTYQCLATNGVGIPAHSAVNIKILYAPEVHLKKSIVNTDEGYDAELTCTVISDPKSNIIWEKDGKQITESTEKHMISFNEDRTQSTLKITGITHEDFGKYVCKAENSYGKGHGHSVVIKQPARASWIADSDSNPMDNNKELKWKIESVQPLTEIELKYLKLDETKPEIMDQSENWILVRPMIQEPNGNEYMITHVLNGLTPGKYAAKIRSRNSHGWSAISEPFIFDGDYMSNEISAGEQTGEAPVAEVGSGVAKHSLSSIAVVLMSIFLCRLV